MSAQLVVNEMLAFLQQKLDVMDEVSAIQICSSNFSQDEIAASKRLLFEVLNKSDQMVSRRRDGTSRSVQDVITLLKETDPDDVPTFVAKDLHKLPPVTFDHVDVTCLLKDIVSLKSSLVDVQNKLAKTEDIVVELRQEIVTLRNNAAICRSPSTANVNTCRGTGRGSNYASAVSLSLTAEPEERATQAPPCSAPASATPTSEAARSPRPAPKPVTSAQVKLQPPPRRSFASVAQSAPTVTPKPLVEPDGKGASDGFITVQKKKRKVNQNRCGTAPAIPKLSLHAAKPNTPVYISRLHYTTTAKSIVEYVRHKVNYTPRVQLLESRRNVNFLSFVVRVPNCFLDRVMKEDFWPQDVVFRRFRGPVPQERT